MFPARNKDSYGPNEGQRKYGGNCWEIFSYLYEKKEDDLYEIAELMYPPGLKSVLLLDFPLCVKITVFNV